MHGNGIKSRFQTFFKIRRRKFSENCHTRTCWFFQQTASQLPFALRLRPSPSKWCFWGEKNSRSSGGKNVVSKILQKISSYHWFGFVNFIERKRFWFKHGEKYKLQYSKFQSLSDFIELHERICVNSRERQSMVNDDCKTPWTCEYDKKAIKLAKISRRNRKIDWRIITG